MTTDLLLSVSDLFLTMGLPSIDESLDKLLVAMESFPKSAILGDTVGYARVLGLLLALCVGSYECWMMMLGRRAMDVMKLARIIALSMCITSSGWICSELQVPGKALENTTLSFRCLARLWRTPPRQWPRQRTNRLPRWN